MNQIPVIEQLADALRCLPGVGPKTAQRMVLHLLERHFAKMKRRRLPQMEEWVLLVLP